MVALVLTRVADSLHRSAPNMTVPPANTAADLGTLIAGKSHSFRADLPGTNLAL